MAKKQKKSRGRKRFEKERNELRMLKGENMRSLVDEGVTIIDAKYSEQSRGINISEAITKVAQPWLDNVETNDEQKNILSAAALAWNYSSSGDEKRSSLLATVSATVKSRFDVPAHEAIVLEAAHSKMIRSLSDRKELLYPNIKCWIVNYDFVDGASGNINLNVATAPID